MSTRLIERVRHQPKFRLAEVRDNQRITPKMARIALCHPDFATFQSAAHDDHVKLFFASPGESLESIRMGADGLDFGGTNPEGREYTVRRFDVDTCEIVIDFVIHGDGLASSWAEGARAGDKIGVSGPRSSFVVRDQPDWYLLAGDETALPAIGRFIEEAREGMRVLAFIEIPDEREKQVFNSVADLRVTWLARAAGRSLTESVREMKQCPGRGYCFVAAEASVSTNLRDILVEQFHVDSAAVNSKAYWRR